MLNRIFNLLGAVLPAMLLGGLLVVVTADVVARLVFARPIHVSHNLAVIALSGVVWFGLIGVAREGQLFGLNVVVDRLPARVRSFVSALVHILIALIAAEVMRAAILQVRTSGFTRFLALGWPKWIVSAGLAAAMAAVILVQIAALWQLTRKGRGK